MADRPPDAPTLPPQTIGFDPDPESTRALGAADADGPIPECAGRIELRGELARGGMGAVLRGHDPALNREVAVKVLLSSLATRPDLVRRFVDEAQVAGQLQHPGVVPIYDLGTFADGRPFFAMKLVQGRTLAELLGARPTVTDDLARFLKIFETVCQAIGYAHSRRIIHRDLKPLNVMVGAFGEVQVMDWGIAKILTDKDADSGDNTADRPVDGTAKQGDSALTAAGSTLGTLAYMPPEQAAGEAVDERADVFGLGAMLCEILTGKPPYFGVNEQVLWKAISADLAETLERLNRCGADVELIALAKNCLAANRAERPANAGAVAAAVSAYLAGVQDRLRRAELERAAAETRAAEERKRRRVQLALAATVLLAMGGVAAGGLWLQHERATRAAEIASQQADAEQRVAVGLQKAKLLQSQGQPAAALAAAEQAREMAADERVTGETREEVGALTEALRIAAEQAERDRLLIERLQDASDIAESPIAPMAGDFRAQREYLVYHYEFVYRFWGADVSAQTDDELLALMLARPPAVRRALASGLDQWAWYARSRFRPATTWQRLIQLAAKMDPDADPIRVELRALALGGQPAQSDSVRARLRDVADRVDSATAQPQTLALLGGELQSAGEAERAVALLEAGARARPGEVLLHERLAHLLLEQTPPRSLEAIPHLQIARALRPQLGARLGMVLADVGRVEDALALCRAAEHVRPDPATPYMRTAQVLFQRGQVGRSLPFFQAAARLAPNDRNAHYQLAVAYEGHAEFAAAIDELGVALAVPPAAPPAIVANERRLAELDASIVVSCRRLLEHCRRRAGLEARLPAVIAGRDEASPADRCELAGICVQKERWRVAVRLYAEAFAKEPRLMESVNSARYNAACAAILAAADPSAERPDEAECARLRRQGLEWLRGEFSAHEVKLQSGSASARSDVLRHLQHWQSDRDLASVRNEADRNKLPPDECSAWAALWSDVAAAMKRTHGN
jgi:serine/threonine-protein kinase